MISRLLLPWQPFLRLGLFNAGLVFVVYSRNKFFSLFVNLYRDVKHYGQHLCFQCDYLPQLICSKSEIFCSMHRGTGNQCNDTATY